jgi:hypothetical protein
MRRSWYPGSGTGAATQSPASTTSWSADPLPWALQVPEQARIIGSTAVTSPLVRAARAGRSSTSPRRRDRMP